MRIVLASNNAGKLAELQTLFAPLGMTLVRQSELNIPEAAEPFKTFVENALAKARHAAQLSGMPALAEKGIAQLVQLQKQAHDAPQTLTFSA